LDSTTEELAEKTLRYSTYATENWREELGRRKIGMREKRALLLVFFRKATCVLVTLAFRFSKRYATLLKRSKKMRRCNKPGRRGRVNAEMILWCITFNRPASSHEQKPNKIWRTTSFTIKRAKKGMGPP